MSPESELDLDSRFLEKTGSLGGPGSQADFAVYKTRIRLMVVAWTGWAASSLILALFLSPSHNPNLAYKHTSLARPF
jgi:hypothetical protein